MYGFKKRVGIRFLGYLSKTGVHLFVNVKVISVAPLIYSSPVMYNATQNCPRENPTKYLLITSLFWSVGNKSKPCVQLYPIKGAIITNWNSIYRNHCELSIMLLCNNRLFQRRCTPQHTNDDFSSLWALNNNSVV